MATYEERLQQITGGRAPEEGDFNTARLTATDTPPPVRRAIQAELQSVECAVSDQDEYEEMCGEADDKGAEIDYFTASCRCGWTGSSMCWMGDVDDLQETKEKILSSHKSEKPDCTLEPTIG